MTARQDMQRQVVEFLSNPANWPEPVTRIEHVQTHISHLFLGRALAFKMKKALRLPYLDFSTLEKRARFCRRELEVNARFSPRLYLGLSRVGRLPDGSLALDPPAEAEARTVEWLVRMRRFQEDDVLVRHVKSHGLPRPLAVRLALMACAAHRAAEVKKDAPFAATLLKVWRQVRDALLPHAQALGAQGLNDTLRELQARLKQADEHLQARAEAGFVRRCHGDMHLGNIVLMDDEPRLFDAIEFDEELATIDVLYDLAFLLMDVRHRGLKEAAAVIMNSWLAHCDEESNHAHIALHAPFMALRAFIRAMVLMDLAAQQKEARQKASISQAAAYVRSAAEALRPSRPFLLAVGGLSGSGKTTLATALAASLAPGAGMVHLRSDVERKVMAGVDEFTRLPKEAYTPEMSARVYERLMRRAALVLKGGWPVLVDAVNARAEERRAFERMAKEMRVPFIGLWLHAPADVLRARVAARHHDASDADVAVLEKQLRYDTGPIDWIQLDASGPPQQLLRTALETLAARGIGIDMKGQ